jgi:hypothetical protein
MCVCVCVCVSCIVDDSQNWVIHLAWFFFIDFDIVDLMNLTSHITLGNIKLVTILFESIVMKDHVIDLKMKSTQTKN